LGRFDFDTLADRSGIDCMKEVLTTQKVREAGLISFSGAEADFRTAPCVTEAVVQRAMRGNLGYTVPGEDYYSAVINWMKTQRNWEIQKDWIVPTGGTIRSVATAIRLLTQPGEGIIVQPPVYYRYEQAASRLGRQTVYNPLKLVNGRYEMDFAQLEECMASRRCPLMILCNPHNPIAQVWKKEDLEKIAQLANRYDVVVFSDEIFAETVYDGNVTVPYSEIPGAADRAIVATSVGKAFSLTGLNFANIIIPNDTLRRRFARQRNADHYGSMEPLTHAAVMGGYTKEGAAWIGEMNQYVRGNSRYIIDFLKEHLPQVNTVEPEGAFVLWIDWNGLGLPKHELTEFLTEEALLLTDPGEEYGPGGEGWTRMCIASPREMIEKAMESLLSAAKKRGFAK